MKFRAARVLAVFAFFASAVFWVSQPGSATEVREPVLFGAHAQTDHKNQPMFEATLELEATIGARTGVMRRYLLWEHDVAADVPSRWSSQRGMIPLVSIVTDRPDRTPVMWRDIADAKPGSPIYEELVALAQSVARLPGEVWFSFHHEPEIDRNLVYGNNQDYIDAYRRVVSEIRLAGAENISFVWTMTPYAFELEPEDSRYGRWWYPGDDVVDQIAIDPFNWYTCRQDVNNEWRSFHELTKDAVAYINENHGDKGLVIAEFGSIEDPGRPGRKAQWVREMAETIHTPAWNRLSAVLMFNASQPWPDTDCRWFVDTSESSKQAYQELLSHEMFGQHLGAEATTCSVVGDSSFAEIVWQTPTPGVVEAARDGEFVFEVDTSQRLFVDWEPGKNSSYTLRVWDDQGQYADTACGPAPQPQDPKAEITVQVYRELPG